MTGAHNVAVARNAPVAPRRKGRIAWRVVGTIVAVAALVSGTSNIVGLLAHEMETRVVAVPAAGITAVEVHSAAGSVTIRAADVTDIVVRARIGHGLRRSGSSVELEGDRLVVRGSCPVFGSQWCDVRYTIDVPAGIDIVVRADDDGVRVTGVTGALDLHSDNGGVRVDDVRGELTMSSDNGSLSGTGVAADTVDARTDNGDVAIEMAVAPESLTARSDNGDVEVVLPDDGGTYAVDIASSNGSVDSELRTDPESDRSVILHSDNGNVSAGYS